MSIEVTPTSPAERYQILDILRGFALFGVLMANVPYHHYAPAFTSWDSAVSESDLLVEQLISVLFTGKFYPLLSFLFGFGFLLMTMRAAQRQKPWVLVYCRRLFGLIVLGFIHSVLLFDGDILLTYGAIGFVLLVTPRISVRTLCWLVAGLYALSTPLVLFGGFLGDVDGVAAYGSGDPGGQFIVALIDRVTTTVLYALLMPLYGLPVLAMMLLGVAAAKGGWLSETPQGAAVRRKARLYCTPLAVVLGASGWLTAGGYGGPFSGWVEPFALVALDLAGPFAALALASWGYLLFAGGGLRGLKAVFASVGRLSLTNYLFQSIILFILFAEPALGLASQLTLTQSLPLALAVYVGSALFSLLWTRYFTLGPFEIPLRAFTYLRWTPLRK